MSSSSASVTHEVERTIDHYRIRDRSIFLSRQVLAPDRFLRTQEYERMWARMLLRHFSLEQLEHCRVLEVGCGFGKNLLNFIRWGLAPENVVGNELLESRCRVARELLPEKVRLIPGDATEMSLPAESFEITAQSTVFASILDEALQQRLAERMWYWTAPGGGVLWYDMAYSNPRNRHVRGVPLRRIGELFPAGRIHWRRVCLAPPIGKAALKVHPLFYHLLATIPWLKTHLCCWIEKPLPK